MNRSLEQLAQEGTSEEKSFVTLLQRPYRSNEIGDDGWWLAAHDWDDAVGAYYASGRGLSRLESEDAARLGLLAELSATGWATPEEVQAAGGRPAS